MTQFGQVIGHAIHAVKQHTALTSDTVLELEFRSEEIGRLLTAETTAGNEETSETQTEIRISVDQTVPAGDESLLQFLTVSGMTPEQCKIALSQLPAIDEVELLAGGGDTREEALFQATVSDPSVSTALAAYDGRITNLTITAEEMRLIAEFPPTADVRAATEAIKEIYPGTELLAQRTHPQAQISHQELQSGVTNILTERQHATLQAAYFAGYFEWPRIATGEEVAEWLGVSSVTFSEHLRAAERKLLTVLYDK